MPSFIKYYNYKDLDAYLQALVLQ